MITYHFQPDLDLDFKHFLKVNLVTPEEDFCMQIDAHTKFIEGWDVRFMKNCKSISTKVFI